MRVLKVEEVVEHNYQKGVGNMKLNEKALANTLGILGAAYYFLCYLVAATFPELYKTIAQTWFHMLDLELAWREAPSGFMIGLTSFTFISWVSGWVFAFLYNKLTK